AGGVGQRRHGREEQRAEEGSEHARWPRSAAGPRTPPRRLPALPPTPTVRRMFEARVRVIYGGTDQMGVVYYANYLRYFELARSELIRAHGGSYVEMEASVLIRPVVGATGRYRAPASYEH